MKYLNWNIDPFNDDTQYYIHVQSAYYSGTWDNIIAPAAENFPYGAATRVFVDLPIAVDISDILGTRPISVYDLTSSGALSRTTGAPGSGEYRIVTNSESKARQKLEVHTSALSHTLGFDYYGLGGVLSQDDVNALIKGVTTVVISSSNSSSQAQTNSDYVIDTTDDAGAKINTIATAMTDGGTIQSLEGYYNVKTIITLANNVNLIGSGAGTYFIKAANIANIINIGSRTGNILKDFVLYGDYASYAGASYHNLVGNASVITQRFINISSSEAGGNGFHNCNNTINCTSFYNQVSGFVNCIFIANSYAYSNTTSGFSACSYIVNCRSNTNTTSGFSECYQVSNSYAYSNTTYGFYIITRVSNCRAYSNTIDGFYLCTQCSDCYSDSNVIGFNLCFYISSCYAKSNSGDGFQSTSGLSACSASNNVIGFDDCNQLSACNASGNSNDGFEGCIKITSCYSDTNGAYGFDTCKTMGFNGAIGNTSGNYNACYADSGTANAVADTSAGGYNHSS